MGIYNRVGLNIKMERKLKNLTQEQLATKMGYSKSFIGSIERGSRRCTLEDIERIAAALELDPMKLIERRDT